MDLSLFKRPLQYTKRNDYSHWRITQIGRQIFGLRRFGFTRRVPTPLLRNQRMRCICFWRKGKLFRGQYSEILHPFLIVCHSLRRHLARVFYSTVVRHRISDANLPNIPITLAPFTHRRQKNFKQFSRSKRHRCYSTIRCVNRHRSICHHTKSNWSIWKANQIITGKYCPIFANECLSFHCFFSIIVDVVSRRQQRIFLQTVSWWKRQPKVNDPEFILRLFDLVKWQMPSLYAFSQQLQRHLWEAPQSNAVDFSSCVIRANALPFTTHAMVYHNVSMAATKGLA